MLHRVLRASYLLLGASSRARVRLSKAHVSIKENYGTKWTEHTKHHPMVMLVSMLDRQRGFPGSPCELIIRIVFFRIIMIWRALIKANRSGDKLHSWKGTWISLLIEVDVSDNSISALTGRLLWWLSEAGGWICYNKPRHGVCLACIVARECVCSLLSHLGCRVWSSP